MGAIENFDIVSNVDSNNFESCTSCNPYCCRQFRCVEEEKDSLGRMIINKEIAQVKELEFWNYCRRIVCYICNHIV